MSTTPASLLERARDHRDSQAWEQLVGLYQPLIRSWVRRSGFQNADADDLVQEVLAVLARALPGFQYDPQQGSFRTWLRVLTVNHMRAFWKRRDHQPQAAGTTSVADLLAQLEDPRSDLARAWDREHDQHVVHRLLELIQPDFEARTWHAFRRVAFDGVAPATVAAELSMSVNAVFIAKSRVLRRLRQEMQGLTD